MSKLNKIKNAENSETKKNKKKSKFFKKALIFSTITAGALGAVYGLVPGVKEVVDEKIIEIIYNTIGPGKLVKNEMVTDLNFEEAKGTLRFTPVEGIKDYYTGVKNLTTGEDFRYHTYSSGYSRLNNMEEFRTGDLLEFYVVAKGDGVKTEDSDKALLQYTIQDMDNIVYRSISEVFNDAIKRRFQQLHNATLRNYSINAIEQESGTVEILGTGITGSYKSANFTYTIDIKALNDKLGTNLSDLRNFKDFVYSLRTNMDKYSGEVQFITNDTNLEENLKEEGLFADLEADGYTVNQLQFSNGEVNSYEQNKVEVTYDALYRAVHPTLKPITFRQTQTFEMDFVHNFTAPKYLAAYKEGAEAVIVSKDREVLDYSLMHHLYEMEDKRDYVSFLETENTNKEQKASETQKRSETQTDLGM